RRTGRRAGLAEPLVHRRPRRQAAGAGVRRARRLKAPRMSEPLHVHFEDLAVGEVVPLGACAVDAAALEVFVERFRPGWDGAYGAPDAMVYALWSRMFADKVAGWAQSKVLAVDGLRYMRNPPAGELMRGRMTV